MHTHSTRHTLKQIDKFIFCLRSTKSHKEQSIPALNVGIENDFVLICHLHASHTTVAAQSSPATESRLLTIVKIGFLILFFLCGNYCLCELAEWNDAGNSRKFEAKNNRCTSV